MTMMESTYLTDAMIRQGLRCLTWSTKSFVKIRSRSHSKYRGWSPREKLRAIAAPPTLR